VGVLCLDVDGLKRVNDRQGHLAGDAVLVTVARGLRRELPRGACAARLSGDEFAVLLPALTSPGQAERLAARLVRSTSPAASLSIGVATAPVGLAQADVLHGRADVALVAAKRDGGAQVTVATVPIGASSLDGALASRHDAGTPRADPGGATSRRRLLAQPVVDAATGEVARVETLLRVTDADGTLRTPMGDVRRAQASGRLDEVTAWVLEESLSAYRSWAGLPAAARVSVNIAAAQVAEPAVARGVLTALREQDLPGSCLALEIHAAGGSPEGLEAAVQVLRRHGVGIVLEDVDEAWALRDVASHRPDEVTLSRALVQALPHDSVARATVRGLAAVAHAVGASLTAKGVETSAQWDAVATTGCDRAQGRFLEPERALTDPWPRASSSVWRTAHLTMRDMATPVLTGARPVGTVHPCTPAFSYAERAFAENQRPRDPSSPAGPGGFLCPRGHFDAAEES
jgi:diguanylate cyclase (GGDEF)-like protein